MSSPHLHFPLPPPLPPPPSPTPPPTPSTPPHQTPTAQPHARTHTPSHLPASPAAVHRRPAQPPSSSFCSSSSALTEPNAPIHVSRVTRRRKGAAFPRMVSHLDLHLHYIRIALHDIAVQCSAVHYSAGVLIRDGGQFPTLRCTRIFSAGYVVVVARGEIGARMCVWMCVWVCLQPCTARRAMAPLRISCSYFFYFLFGRRRAGSGRLCAAVGADRGVVKE